MVDRYRDLAINSSYCRDPVEIRANAFAIAFLAPPAAVDRMVYQADDIPTAVFEVVRHFGVSVTAAAAHVVRSVHLGITGDGAFPHIEAFAVFGLA